MGKRLAGFWPQDWLHLFFITAQAVVTACSGMSQWGLWVVFDLGAMVWLGGLILASDGLAVRREALLRMLHGAIVIPLVFTQVGLTIQALGLADNAALLEAADRLLFFGVNPLEAMERICHPLLSEVMQWAYCSYVLLPPAAGLLLAFLGTPAQIGRALFSMLAIMYLSYIGYYLLPAMGPNIHNTLGPLGSVNGTVLPLYHFQDPQHGIWLADHLRQIMFSAELTKKDCFPSGHVAMAVACVVYAFRVRKLAGCLFLPVGFGVVLSTMYLRYHYVVDVIAGMALALFCVTVLEGLALRSWSLVRSSAPGRDP